MPQVAGDQGEVEVEGGGADLDVGVGEGSPVGLEVGLQLAENTGYRRMPASHSR